MLHSAPVSPGRDYVVQKADLQPEWVVCDGKGCGWRQPGKPIDGARRLPASWRGSGLKRP